jgi:L-ascorbate metabolism protein UlaG (beta-lactamase superfamily)
MLFKKIMFGTLITLVVLAIGTFLFMQQPAFGKNPKGKRLEQIQQSPNYKDGAFQNQSSTAVLRPDASYWLLIRDNFNKPKDNTPLTPIPSVKTDLTKIADDKATVIWFGHSSYLIKTKGKNILVDPVFSGHASPVSFAVKAFEGSNVYGVNDMPPIDICIITHNHYDHLDYETIKKIHPNVKQFYTALGVGADLEAWGVPAEKIVELDWWESNTNTDSIKITATPARHFSGRGFVRAKTLWASYVININDYQIYVGGDSGYDKHFKAIGEKFGSFDLALLECGQYGNDWPFIHMTPEEVVTAAKELNTKALMPVHWAKFALAMHSWTDPIERLLKANETETTHLTITTPLIGEPVVLGETLPTQQWWK